VKAKSGALPSLSRTLTKLEADGARHAENASRLLHRAENVTLCAGRLIQRLSTRNSDGTKKNDKSNGLQVSTQPVVGEHHHWVKKMSWVWAFLVKETQLVKRHTHRKADETGEPDQSTCSTAAPPSPQDTTPSDISGLTAGDGEQVCNMEKKRRWFENECNLGKSGNMEKMHQGRSGKHHKHHEHFHHRSRKHHRLHVEGPSEETWTLDDASSDFSDEHLLLLFEFFANHKDYSGKKLMALDEWEKFFVVFEEHFEGISPGIEQLSHSFTKNLNLQVDMHFAHNMEKGEASRGLNFENFKFALHETIGHHWHHADMEDSWDDTMNRQSHGTLHGMA
jgi:hypothetical protein